MNKEICFVILVTSLFISSSSTAAETSPAQRSSFSREFSLFLQSPRQQFGGNFDGEHYYAGPDAIVIVPDVKPAFGIGIGAGIKSNVGENVAIGIEIFLNTAQHDATWLDVPVKATSFHLDFDFKLFTNVQSKVQPFLLGGFSSSGLEVEDGHLSPSGFKDVTFNGRGIHVGAGLNYYVTPHFSLNGSFRNRWLEFDEIDYGSRSKLDQPLKSTGIDISLGLAYHFNLS